MLQGIPTDDLLLTKETEDNLKDLAGNAMSTTVVGVCALAALLVGHSALPAGDGIGASRSIVPSLVPRPLAPPSEVTIDHRFGDYEQCTVELSPRLQGNAASFKKFLVEASLSVRMCVSEGQEEAIPFKSLVQCRECGHTASASNAYPPRKYEEHEYQGVAAMGSRVEPVTFRRKLLDLLPMRLTLGGFDLDRLDAPRDVNLCVWEEWVEILRGALITAQAVPVEFRLIDLVRTHIWTAVYSCHDTARLEARITKCGVTWMLFARVSQNDGPLKTILERPIARMNVDASRECVSMLDGKWEVCLPITSKVSLCIEGNGKRVPSWRSRIGLKGGLETEFQFENLTVSIESADSDQVSELKARIEGDYKLLPKCGGACGSLRKKVGKKLGGKDDDMYFFLSSGRKTLKNEDPYVFSPICHRAVYGEYNEICLQIDSEIDFRLVLAGGSLPEGATNSKIIVATLHGRWMIAENAAMKSSPCSNMVLVQPNSSLSVLFRPSAWQICPVLLSCTVQVTPSENIVIQCKKTGGSVEVNLQKSKKVFREIAFATSRLTLPSLFADGRWLELDQTELAASVNEEVIVCQKCAPTKPRVKWTLVSKGNKTTFVPVEDGRDAAVYERALKSRPHPWIVRLSIPEDLAAADTWVPLTLRIGCNAVSLVQRALGLFPVGTLARKSMIDLASGKRTPVSSKCTFEWRIVPHNDKVFTGFSRLSFTSNKQDVQAAQPPRFAKYGLRKEQLRSLTWMLLQESAKIPFLEEEVAEAVLPSLDWRAEGRVRRPVLVRGGIVADEVCILVQCRTINGLDDFASNSLCLLICSLGRLRQDRNHFGSHRFSRFPTWTT